ncbi:MAG: FecR domain-containing protein, partial [Anaerolineales bacterium]|nr:FecR domain-containing protein [Anaerolineales bacterium]
MNPQTTDKSTFLLQQMAQRAASDKNLLAYQFNAYGKKKGIDWGQLAENWHIQSDQFAKLALCRRPSSINEDSELNQISTYTGVDKRVLKQLLESLEEQPQKNHMKEKPVYWNRAGNITFRRRVWAVGVAFLIFLLFSAFVVAQPPQGTEATLVISAGEATVTQKGNVPLLFRVSDVNVSSGQALAVHAGDKIALQSGAVGQLRLFGGSTVDLAGGTSLEITELVTDQSTYRVRLNMLAGRTVSRVVRALGIGDTFEVRTPSSTASVRGTVFTVEVVAQDASYFSCDEGVVHIVLGDESVDIHPGEEVNAVVGRPLTVQP